MTEKESSYCESVLDALENPNYQNSAFNHEKSTRTDGNHTEKAPTSKAQRLQASTLEDDVFKTSTSIQDTFDSV